ncbi:YhdP family protein [Aquitalea pelogenes]|uniref:YhdP family protein n=1 Tax=Aquitalea pelogenes TaxID=1293573 RepID=UPI0007879AD4|nr:YhdP family protein [Aquitalea pelogenes]
MEKPLYLLARIHVIRLLRRVLRIAGLLLVLAILMIGSAFSVFNWWFLPRLEQFRPQLEHSLSEASGRQVSIAALSGQWLWQDMAPQLQLGGLRIANPVSGDALTLQQVTVLPSWLSLLSWQPLFSSIVIQGPSVALVRNVDGHILLNGFDLSASPARPEAAGSKPSANWLLRQRRIEISQAHISWEDKMFGLPRLDLQGGQLVLGKTLLGHRLTLSGRPVVTLGKGFDMELTWRGNDFSQWRDWSGNARVRLNGAQAGMLSRYMEKVGLVNRGEGSGTLEADFSDGHINSLQADVSIHNAAYTPRDAHTLVLPVISGKLQLERSAKGAYVINASNLTLASSSGLAFDNSSIRGDWLPGEQGHGQLTLDNVNVAHLTPFIRALGGDGNSLFSRFAPSGQLKNLSLGWTGPLQSPRQYTVATRFDSLAWQAFASVPGISGVSGSLRFGEQGGSLQLDSRHATLNYPVVFPQLLNFDRLNARVDWKNQGKQTDVDFQDVSFANADLTGRFGGHYHHGESGPGVVDFTASVDQVAAERVPAYLPHAVGEDTLRWLKQALLGGTARDVRMILKGDLADFPFAGGKGGQFSVDAKVEQGKLLYEKGWPTIDNIQADLGFHNEKMLIAARSASTLGVPLSAVQVGIDNLGATQPVLTVQGRAQGQLASMLKFTTASPVDGWLDGFTGNLQAGGNAALNLKLGIPLSGHETPKVRGDILLSGNQLGFRTLPIPPLSQAQGTLTFTEHGVESSGVAFKALGGAFVLKAASTAAGRMNFDIRGEADSKQALDRYLPVLAPYVSGHAPFGIQFAVQKGLENLTVQSGLQGVNILAPAPAGKQAADVLPLSLRVTPGKTAQQPVRLDLDVGTVASGSLLLDEHGNLKTGVIASGRPVGKQPDEGLLLRLAAPKVDLPAWVDAIAGPSGLHGNAATAGKSLQIDLPLQIDLETAQLDSWAGSLHKVTASLGNRRIRHGWSLDVRAHEMSGNIEYLPEGNGLLRANLAYALLNPPEKGSAADGDNTMSDKGDWPALDIHVGDLVYQNRSVGKLDVRARREGRDWLLNPLRLDAAEGSLQGSVRVRRSEDGKEVDARYRVDSTDVGKLLARVGLQDTFRKGEGTLAGNMRWPGGLFDLSVKQLSGDMTLSLKNGRFAKVDPGAARLLGVLSLQSLTRRVKLDFTDVFSDGFAFDSITGDARISKGVFVSDNVHLKGPAADVFLSGQVNLASETQDVHIKVQPHLAESVALAAGAALLNPVVGVAALAAQKVFQDPVGKILSVEYDLTGSFANPKVEKRAVEPLRNSKRIITP